MTSPGKSSLKTFSLMLSVTRDSTMSNRSFLNETVPPWQGVNSNESGGQVSEQRKEHYRRQ